MKENIALPVYNSEGKEIETYKLDSSVFDGTVNAATIYQTVNAYRANQRLGLASTKTRGEVSGGGRKPWRQKGTGRARIGSTRSPLWRHGGVIFGPHPRDFSVSLPKKIKDLALKSALNEKVKENNLIILDSFSVEKPKTKEAEKVLTNLKALGEKKQRVLFLMEGMNNNVRLALRNIGFLNVNLAKDTNTYEILSHAKVIVTKDALRALEKRLK